MCLRQQREDAAGGDHRGGTHAQTHQFLGAGCNQFHEGVYSYGHLPVISTYNPIYRMYNPIYTQL